MATKSLSITRIRYTSNTGSYWNDDATSGQHGASQTAAMIVFTIPENITCSSLSLNWRAQIPNRDAPALRTIYFAVSTSSNYSPASSSNNHGYWSATLNNNPQNVPVTLTYNFKPNTTYYITVNSSDVCDWFKDGVTLTYEYNDNYTVSYNANGGSGAPSSQTKIHGTTLTLSATKPTKADSKNTVTGSFVITGYANGGYFESNTSITTTTITATTSRTDTTEYTFSSWNTNSAGTGTSYSAEGSYTANENVTLYAQYSSSITTGTTTYSNNSVNLLTEPTRPGYTFLGWATSSSATTPNAANIYTSTKTLYAVWGSPATIHTKINGEWKSGEPYIKVSGQWKPAIEVYIKKDGQWKLSK